MVFEERLDYLRKLIKEKDKIKTDAVELASQHLGLVKHLTSTPAGIMGIPVSTQRPM